MDAGAIEADASSWSTGRARSSPYHHVPLTPPAGVPRSPGYPAWAHPQNVRRSECGCQASRGSGVPRGPGVCLGVSTLQRRSPQGVQGSQAPGGVQEAEAPGGVQASNRTDRKLSLTERTGKEALMAQITRTIDSAETAKRIVLHTAMVFEQNTKLLASDAHNTARLAADALDHERRYLEEALEQIRERM